MRRAQTAEPATHFFLFARRLPANYNSTMGAIELQNSPQTEPPRIDSLPGGDGPPSGPGRLAWSFLSRPESWHELRLRSEWEELLDQSGNIHAIFQSPTWLDHIRATGAYERLSLAVARNERGGSSGRFRSAPRAAASRSTSAAAPSAESLCSTVWLLGSEPLVPADYGTYESLFQAVDGAFPDSQCISLSSVPRSSPIWDTFNRRRSSAATFCRTRLTALATTT